MNARVVFIYQTVRQHLALWLLLALAFTGLYYLVLMASLIVRFDNLPNYINSYDWGFSVKRILVSTPSMLDSLKIIQDEWLFEIGYMNYDFGKGISEWSLFINPFKVLGVFILGIAISTNYLLLRSHNRICSRSAMRNSKVATGFGATFVALASMTMSWVVCCSTPTWVVGLAMMGLGVSASLWLEPVGVWVNIAGYAALALAVYIAASKSVIASQNQ